MMMSFIFQDCPNEFKPYNNKCYRWLGTQSFSEHVETCDYLSGKLLSGRFEANDPSIMVAKEMMTSNSVNQIYLGKFEHFELKMNNQNERLNL